MKFIKTPVKGMCDMLPADMRLTKVSDLFVSQGAITGESTILEKNSR